MRTFVWEKECMRDEEHPFIRSKLRYSISRLLNKCRNSHVSNWVWAQGSQSFEGFNGWIINLIMSRRRLAVTALSPSTIRRVDFCIIKYQSKNCLLSSEEETERRRDTKLKESESKLERKRKFALVLNRPWPFFLFHRVLIEF